MNYSSEVVRVEGRAALAKDGSLRVTFCPRALFRVFWSVTG
jgi:hypothetical protein